MKITSEIAQDVRNMHSFYIEEPDGVPVEFLQRHDAARIRDAQLFGFTLDGTELLSLIRPCSP